MVRSALLMLAGAVAGAATVWLIAPSPTRDPESATPALPEPTALPAAATLDGAEPRGFAGERLAIYEQAAGATDSIAIESLIERALDGPPSRLRDLRVSALLARYAEIDVQGAVQFARDRYLDPKLLVPLFESLADSNPDAAVRELASISPPALRHEIAMAMLRVVGNDTEGFELIASALPGAERVSFEIDAMTARIAENPGGALSAWLGMPNSLYRAMLLPRVAEIAAMSDPVAALNAAASIDDYPLRRQFTDAVVLSWANLDPAAAFAWLETASFGQVPESAVFYRALAASDSARLLAMIDGLPNTVRNFAQQAAMQGVAEQDPASALAMLGSMPPGAERDSLMQSVAVTYGRQSPDLALAWARSLPSPQSQTALTSVMQGIAANDPLRAIDLLLVEIENSPAPANPFTALTSASSPTTVLMSITLNMAMSGGDFAPIVNRLLDSSSPQVGTMLRTTVSAWARQDLDAAVNWALSNGDRLDRATFTSIASSLAMSNADGALAIVDRLPADQRAPWVEGLVQGLSLSDPQRAISLLESFRGQPGYEAAYLSAAQRIASSDPVRAAELVRSMPASASQQSEATMTLIVGRLASSDPAQAVDMALGLTQPGARQMAMNQVASGWAGSDPVAAEQWVRSLSEGPERDQALDGYLRATAADRFDPRLLESYSTPVARERGASLAIREIGKTDLPEARRLLGIHITDEALRRQTEASLAQTGGVGSGDTFVRPPLPIR